MSTMQSAEAGLVGQLLATLQQLPGVKLLPQAREPLAAARSRRHDAEIALDVGGSPVTLRVEVRKSVFPRDVRELLWQVRQPGSAEPHGLATVSLLAAESISEGAKQLLRTQQVGYFDAGGSLFMAAQGAYIFIDKPVPKPLAKSIRALYNGRRAQVLQVLLHQPREWLGVKALAEQAQVSPATASETLGALEQFEWVSSRGQGPAKERALVDPGALLDAWAAQAATIRQSPMKRYFVPATNAGELLDRTALSLEASGAMYAATHEAAAQRYSPFLSHVSQVRCRLIESQAATAALAELDARPVHEGANLVVMVAKSPGDFLFRERVGSAWLANPCQVYLDLMAGEGRAKEMAAHLREQRIGF